MKNLSVFNQLSIISPISFWHSFGAFKVWTVTRRIFFFYGMHGTNSKKHLKKTLNPGILDSRLQMILGRSY